MLRMEQVAIIFLIQKLRRYGPMEEGSANHCASQRVAKDNQEDTIVCPDLLHTCEFRFS